MNDETRQMREMLFDRIVFGLILVGLITALSSLVIGGFSSPWFFRAIALMIVALVAFGLRRVSRLVVAVYILVLELFGIATAIFLQSSVVGFIPYLFIPIIIIAGLLLNPLATILIGLLAVVMIVLVVALTQQLSGAVFITLLPPFSLIIVALLLVIEGRRHIEKLGEHLLESRKLLRERTLEMMEAQDKITELQARTEELKQQLLTGRGEAHQAHQLALQKSQGLHQLIKGAINELDTSVEELERLVDQIGESASPNEQAGLLEKVWQRIYHLNNLVVNLEDMAQLKNERVALNYQEVDITHLINEVVSTTRGLARGKNLEIRCQVPENLPKLKLDPVRIRQVLLYVLNNAVKYTDQGIIEVQAELNAKELLIFVSDTGIGMHREEMELVFQEFGRGSGTLAKQRQGTGLGLAISKGLVELHGGHMWVTSVLGVGSTFYINLPLEPPPAKTPAAIPAPMPAAAIPAQIPLAVTVLEQEEPVSLWDTINKKTETQVAVSDQEETLAAAEPATIAPTAKGGFGSPVGRYSPTYIGRFGFILLGLLLIIASIVAMLAVIYGPVGEEEVAATTVASPTSIAAGLPDTATPEESIAPAPTATPSATSSPTVAPPASATPTLPPTEPPTLIPTDTPAATIPATNTSTPTQEPPTLTVTSTKTPTQTPNLIPQPTAKETPPAALVEQPPTRPAAQGLSFVAGQLVALNPLGDTASTSLETAGSIVPDSGLSWSPQGDRILFTSKRDNNYEIYTANADGSQPLNLTKAAAYDTQPSWSPDGHKIAFSSGRDGNVDIYMMDADGGNLQKLTTSRGYDEWPVWSPDGRKIAFVSDRDGNVEIYVMNIDGSNQQRLTDNPAADWPATWSADGHRLAFGSDRDGNWNLYLVSVTDGGVTRLTNDPADEREPAWSPDGRTIAFAYNGGGNWDIYTIPAPTGASGEIPKSEWTQFTDTPTVNEHYPAWAP
ncbi:MAG: PD40 domain-containing protein [Anaerolineae bacterium]|nr:PD40 domain-containing protein [Anaerolineae bacterium]